MNIQNLLNENEQYSFFRIENIIYNYLYENLYQNDLSVHKSSYDSSYKIMFDVFEEEYIINNHTLRYQKTLKKDEIDKIIKQISILIIQKS